MEPEYRAASYTTGGGPNHDARAYGEYRPRHMGFLPAESIRGGRCPRGTRAAARRSVRDQRGDPLGHFAHRDDGLDRPALGIDGGDGFDGGVGDVDRLAVRR